jgi:hypothetical protein
VVRKATLKAASRLFGQFQKVYSANFAGFEFSEVRIHDAAQYTVSLP